MIPSPRSPRRRASLTRLLLGAVLALTTVGLILPGPALGIADIHPGQHDVPGYDKRTGKLLPTSAQRSMVANLGANVEWNRWGTPHSLIRYGGYLKTGLTGADAASVARSWITTNRALFKMASVTSSNLVTLNVSRMRDTSGHVVVFRQRFGTLQAGVDGMIHVALSGSRSAGWRIAYVASTAVGTASAPVAASLTAQQAWSRAAADVGRVVVPTDIKAAPREHTWTMFQVKGFTQAQRARPVALPTIVRGSVVIRPAYEANVVDFGGTETLGVTSFVDAVSGAVLVRHDRVAELAADHTAEEAQAPAAPQTTAFDGSFGPGAACSPYEGPFAAPEGTQSINVVALSPGNDIILQLHFGQGNTVAASDIPVGANPEVINYDPATPVPAGNYFVRVCPFSADEPAPPNFVGEITINDTADSNVPYPPKWRWFEGNPPITYPGATTNGIINPQTGYPSTDTRATRCWETNIGGTPVPRCTTGYTALRNLASRAPWDVLDQNTGNPTFTTIGNNANTAEAWLSPPTILLGSVTPGAFGQRPVSSSREYIYEWSNEWFTSKCNPAVLTPDPQVAGAFVPGGNDIEAAVTQLFTNHDRMHDWSYWLGFTEENSNFQVTNYGLTTPARQNDPEVGNVQSGAIAGGSPLYDGRDNANQLTLQDGIPGITNQYLFQAIPTIFYAPCVDADYDVSVVGHEYTHGISNRMVGGPDGDLTSDAGGSMGESWSDLIGTEYLHVMDTFQPNTIPAGQNPLAIGPYATGNNKVGIRNYAVGANAWNPGGNPLNYSNVGWDTPGAAVHSDGEIWNATNWDIRALLIAKYNSSHPYSNGTLQRQCSEGTRTTSPLPANRCPGNRRWTQIVFDAWPMMPSDVEMTGARDAYLAADVIRFNGANQTELWRGFARRGLGAGATPFGEPTDLPSNDDPLEIIFGPPFDYHPTPSFRSPREEETRVTFNVVALNEGGAAVTKAKIYVGRYQGRTTPVADTDPATARSNQVFMVPGTYEFLVVAPGYGHVRVPPTAVHTTGTTVRVAMPTNWASKTKGATATQPGVVAGDFAENQEPDKLIDDEETTSWRSPVGPDTDPAVIVDLAGTAARSVKNFRVSAIGMPGGGSRFWATRKFSIGTCVAGGAVNCTLPAHFTTRYTSSNDFFPGTAPRPVAPNLNIREVSIPTAVAATHVRFVALENQCTGYQMFQTGYADSDPTDSRDCRIGSVNPLLAVDGDTNIRATEFQVLSSGAAITAKDPVVAVTASAPATAAPGATVDYTVTYRNLGPETASSAKITTVLPAGLTYRSATGPGTESYNSSTRTVTWTLGNVPVGSTGTVTLRATIPSSTTPGTVLAPVFQFEAPLTVANPATAITLVL